MGLYRESLPAGMCLVKVNNRNTRTRCGICSKLTAKTPERRTSIPPEIVRKPISGGIELISGEIEVRHSGVFTVNSEIFHISF